MSMFCYQCEQTAKGTGCTMAGVCGKDATTADLQDLVVQAAKGVAMYATRAAKLGARDRAIDLAVVEALFTTVTNVNFDPERLRDILLALAVTRDQAKAMYEAACAKAGVPAETLAGAATWQPATDLAGLTAQGEAFSPAKRNVIVGATLGGVEYMILLGLKGMAAYIDHAQVLGVENTDVYAFVHETLAKLAERDMGAGELLALALKVGEVNLTVMGMLDAANTGAYGHPEPTAVRITAVAGKAILVSGHDLLDLYELLKQTEGKGVNVYTHGEMLPACSYPKLKAFKHLVGNYGGAWQDQAKEFDAFPGAILMTTNCIQRPRETYKARIFTSGIVAFPGVAHIKDRNFQAVIDAALAAPGFTADEPAKTIMGGFAHHTVMSVADKVVAAVKAGAVKRFFLIGGCDGAKPGRNYYTDFAQQVPQDCIILTLACGKYRFNKLEFGDIGGIPRLLDCGQCNDAYSAIQIAVALAKAFNCGVNDLPLSLVLSWYEQKAVVILLTLLHLGIRNIKLGPTLPAFITPDVLKILVDNFAIAPTTTPEQDLAQILT